MNNHRQAILTIVSILALATILPNGSPICYAPQVLDPDSMECVSPEDYGLVDTGSGRIKVSNDTTEDQHD